MVCVCVRVYSFHMHPSVHSCIHALTHAYTWVQHQLPTKCYSSLWQPRKPVIPATTAACLTAACTVNVSTLLSFNCKDNLPRLVPQSLATTISSMVKHIKSYPQALRLSMTHPYPQALSLSMTQVLRLSMTHSYPQALSLSMTHSYPQALINTVTNSCVIAGCGSAQLCEDCMQRPGHPCL